MMKREYIAGMLALALGSAPLALAAPATPAAAPPAEAQSKVTVIAADEVPPSQPATSTKLAGAATAVIKEIQQVLDGKETLVRKLERLTTFRHTPETAAALMPIFGNERPWSLEKRATSGAPAYRWTLQPLRLATPGGSFLEWSDFPVDLTIDKSGKGLQFDGTWTTLSFESESGRVEMRDATVSGVQRQGSGPFWLGTMEGNIASVAFDVRKPQAASFMMRDLWMRSQVQERAKTVEYAQSFGIKAFEVAGEQLDDLVFSYRLRNLDKAALTALYQADRKLDAKRTPAAELEAFLPLFRQFARTASKNRTTLHVDEISATYHGHKAVLSGSVVATGVTEADLKDMARFVKRIDARFELRVPVSLLREVATRIAQQQAKAAQGGAAPDVAKTAQDMTDAMVGKVLGNGYARLENGVLVAPIAFRGGVLRVNGKLVEMPKKPAPQQGKLPPAKLHTFMQARRINDSCTLPDYPAAVIERDAPLEVRLRYTVDANGVLRDVQVAQASAEPGYDAAVLQAFGSCRFIPALQEGKAVEHTDTFTLSRAPGSTRP